MPHCACRQFQRRLLRLLQPVAQGQAMDQVVAGKLVADQAAVALQHLLRLFPHRRHRRRPRKLQPLLLQRPLQLLQLPQNRRSPLLRVLRWSSCGRGYGAFACCPCWTAAWAPSEKLLCLFLRRRQAMVQLQEVSRGSMRLPLLLLLPRRPSVAMAQRASPRLLHRRQLPLRRRRCRYQATSSLSATLR